MRQCSIRRKQEIQPTLQLDGCVQQRLTRLVIEFFYPHRILLFPEERMAKCYVKSVKDWMRSLRRMHTCYLWVCTA